MNRMFRKKFSLWLAAIFGTLTVLNPTPASALTEPNACNGVIEICSKPFDQVVLPGTHNSMSNQEYHWASPNQAVSIPNQLSQGIRAFLIDTYYGEVYVNGGIITVAKNQGHADGNTMYLCHGKCELGATELIPELAQVADFLAAHPREVLAFVVEDHIHPDDFAAAVTASGLIDYIYTGPTDSYPTVEEMINSGQRVVMLAEQDSGSVPWFHNAYDGAMQETPYNFRVTEAGTGLTTPLAIDQLTNASNLASSCRPNRGGSTGALFLMNHWVNGSLSTGDWAVPDRAVAALLNTKAVLVNRARACEARRGRLPSIIAVDQFVEIDGLIAATNELNGVPPVIVADPEPVVPAPAVPALKPMSIRVKAPQKVQVHARKTAVFKVAVTNLGDVAGPARLCAKVPAAFAKKPRCVTRTIKPGAKVVVKIKVKTQSKAQGKTKVRFVATAAGKSVKANSNLVVKRAK
jgi:hypothetical protein